MPRYDYCCKECSFTFEVRRGFSEEGPVLCPKCQGRAEQMFTPATILLKGSGFYSTDRQTRSWWQKPGMDGAIADARLAVNKEHEKE